jgi:hypothetical protein
LIEPDRRELRSRSVDRFREPATVLRTARVLSREHELVGLAVYAFDLIQSQVS